EPPAPRPATSPGRRGMSLAIDQTLVDAIHDELLARWGDDPPARGLDTSLVCDLVRREAPLLPAAEVAAVVGAVRARVTGLGPLDPLVADDGISEVMVNGDGRVWIERAGVVADTGMRLDHAMVHRLIERIVAPLGLRVDRSSPLADARLPDGSRV